MLAKKLQKVAKQYYFQKYHDICSNKIKCIKPLQPDKHCAPEWELLSPNSNTSL